MSNIFEPIPIDMDFIRKISVDGQWAVITKIPPIGKEDWALTGLGLLDKVFIYNEQLTVSVLDNYRKYLKDEKPTEKNWRRFRNRLACSSYERVDFIYDLHTRVRNKVYRMYDFELNLSPSIDEEFINEVYEVEHFNYGNLEKFSSIPEIVEENLRDILGALQLDGLTFNESIHYLLVNNVLDSKESDKELNNLNKNITCKKPNYFYKVKDIYKDYFN